MSKEKSVQVMFPTGFLLFLVFLVLKLTNVIQWSWLWVSAPLWVPIAFGLGFMAIFAIIGVIAFFISLIVIYWNDSRKNKLKSKGSLNE